MKRIVNFIKTITLLIIMYAYAYFLVVKLCYNPKYKKVRIPKILIIRYKNKAFGGETSGREIIYLNFYKNTDLNILKNNIYHEFRHMWQRAYLPDDFLWWTLFHYDIYKNADIYYYSTIEMDARRFANSLGKKGDDIIFKLLPTCDLDIAYNEGRLLSLQASVYSYLQAHGDDLS